MVIATHEMGFAREVADEVCFLHEGRIVERGAPDARCSTTPEQPETQRFLRRLLEARRAIVKGGWAPVSACEPASTAILPERREEPRDVRSRACA